MGTSYDFFNRYKAVQYAIKWALSRNAAFPDYSLNHSGGGDCTNFVSQAMLAGGWPISWGNHYDPRSWWSSDKDSSKGWSVAENFRWYLEKSSRARPCYEFELLWGDIVLILEDGRTKHAMIVTDVKESQSSDRRDTNPVKDIYVCGHSNDRLNMPLKFVWKYHANRENAEFWKVSDIIPNAPEPSMSAQSIPDNLHRNI